ncbi:MAG: hypothetical protein M1838_002479 [Thelocarpon superellum]|nr:MAG: hypothetical protein M1838_002479 [Thelocarpon superellum]
MRLSKEWKTPKLVYALFVVEFGGTVAMLAFFGIAAPNLYRTALWKDGALNGFNSDPDEILYAYANYQPIPTVPLVWSQFLTNWNLVISVLSMFLLLVKGVMHVMHLFYPWLSLLVHLLLVGLYAVSIAGQAGSDYSDPAHPSPRPWYLTQSCSVAMTPQDEHYCELAKGTFAVTVIMLSIFALHVPLALLSLLPSKRARHARTSSVESDVHMTKFQEDAIYSPNRTPVLPKFPPPPKVPITPRTQAFNKLTQSLPFRKYEEM